MVRFGFHPNYNGKQLEGSELGCEDRSEAVRSGHICFDIHTIYIDWLEPMPFQLLTLFNFIPALKIEQTGFTDRWAMQGEKK